MNDDNDDDADEVETEAGERVSVEMESKNRYTHFFVTCELESKWHDFVFRILVVFSLGRDKTDYVTGKRVSS